MKKLMNITMASALMISLYGQSMRAESKAIAYGKKAAKLMWHCAEVGVGGVLGFVVVISIPELVTCKGDNKDDDSKLGLVMFSIASPSLLINGLSGIDKELQIVERIKKLRSNKK
jgi:hypothetical protein